MAVLGTSSLITSVSGPAPMSRRPGVRHPQQRGAGRGLDLLELDQLELRLCLGHGAAILAVGCGVNALAQNVAT